jgi:hypothetical protein
MAGWLSPARLKAGEDREERPQEHPGKWKDNPKSGKE